MVSSRVCPTLLGAPGLVPERFEAPPAWAWGADDALLGPCVVYAASDVNKGELLRGASAVPPCLWRRARHSRAAPHAELAAGGGCGAGSIVGAPPALVARAHAALRRREADEVELRYSNAPVPAAAAAAPSESRPAPHGRERRPLSPPFVDVPSALAVSSARERDARRALGAAVAGAEQVAVACRHQVAVTSRSFTRVGPGGTARAHPHRAAGAAAGARRTEARARAAGAQGEAAARALFRERVVAARAAAAAARADVIRLVGGRPRTAEAHHVLDVEQRARRERALAGARADEAVALEAATIMVAARRAARPLAERTAAALYGVSADARAAATGARAAAERGREDAERRRAAEAAGADCRRRALQQRAAAARERAAAADVTAVVAEAQATALEQVARRDCGGVGPAAARRAAAAVRATSLHERAAAAALADMQSALSVHTEPARGGT